MIYFVIGVFLGYKFISAFKKPKILSAEERYIKRYFISAKVNNRLRE